jgi:hypothetical protein
MAVIQGDREPIAVFEDLEDRKGSIVFMTQEGVCLTLPKSLEPTKVPEESLYRGRTIDEITGNKRDILAEEILAEEGDPTFEKVAACLPPLKYCTFVGTRHSIEKIEFDYGGASSLYIDSRKIIKDVEKIIEAKDVWEGLIGGFLPVVRFVFPVGDKEWWEMVVFAEEDPTRVWTQPGWYRFLLVEDGEIKESHYFHHHLPFPPRPEPPAAEFYEALAKVDKTYKEVLAAGMQIDVPDERIPNFCAHSLVREMITRIKDHPKYGTDIWGRGYRVGYGFINVDTFQDVFTSTVIAHLEWGLFDVAKRYIEDYFTESVREDGSIDTRGPEIGQYGRMLTVLAQYYNYTKDKPLVLKYRTKLLAIVDLLLDFRKKSQDVPADDPTYGIIRGWSEHDSCLRYDPYNTFMLPYLSNNAEVARGFRDFGKVLVEIGKGPKEASLAAKGTLLIEEAVAMQKDLHVAAERSIHRDQNPPYLPGIAGDKDPVPPHKKENIEHGMWIVGRVYSEQLHSGMLTTELVKTITDYQSATSERLLGLLRGWGGGEKGRGLLGFIVYGYAYGILKEDWVREFLLFYYAHMAHLHTRGTWTAAELSNIDGTEFTAYCSPAQMTIPALTKWMLVFEEPDEPIVWLAKAAPREWFEQGKKIRVKRAPTKWGMLDYELRSEIDHGKIHGTVNLPAGGFQAELRIRFRAPAGKRMQAVKVNGESWKDFDPGREVVNLPASGRTRIDLEVSY